MTKNKYPFKFLDAYKKEDEDIFFGREAEIDTLYEMVFESNVLFLYGASGTGKTSLLRCGLANRFKETHWSELFVLRGTNINTALLDTILKNTPQVEIEEFDFSDELDDQVETDDIATASTETNKVVDALQKLYRLTFNPIYLIFDQFEELFILGDKKEQDEFISTVKEILQANIPCRLLFSMREEYLANLYEFEREVPQLLERKFRVARMSYRNAQDIILKATSLKNSNVHLEKGKENEVASTIVDKIREGRIEIQLPIFQVMMDSLYVKATGEKINRTKAATFDLKLLEDVGTIEDLLASFLNDRANTVYEALQKTFPSIPENFVWQFLSPFATLEGTKVPLSIDDINAKFQRYPTEWLDRCRVLLEDNRILRYQEEGDFYELMHDVLAKEVAKDKDTEQIGIETAERLIQVKFPRWKEDRNDEKLLTKEDLAIILPWLNRINFNNALERKFIQLSETISKLEIAKLKKEKTEAETNALKALVNEKKAKENELKAKINEKRAKRLSKLAIVITVVALGAVIFAIIQFQEAKIALSLAQHNLNMATPDYFNRAVKAQHSDEYPLFERNKDGTYDFERILYDKIDTLDFSMLRIAVLPKVITLCSNLQSLDLSYNQISDYSFLERLLNLESLGLSYNQISDYSFLERLPNLESLDLSYNQISDYSFLEKLPNLQSLGLSSNQITDYSFLARLPNLQSLDLSSNQISDYSFLEKLPNLQSLGLSSNQITDYSFLARLPNLRSLDLRSNQISDISYLEKLTSLQSIDLSYNQISDISYLEKLTSLQSIELRDNQITDISYLEKLTSLESLDLSYNQISDYSFLEKLPNLQSLDLRDNQISDEDKKRLKEKLPGCDIKFK